MNILEQLEIVFYQYVLPILPYVGWFIVLVGFGGLIVCLGARKLSKLDDIIDQELYREPFSGFEQQRQTVKKL